VEGRDYLFAFELAEDAVAQLQDRADLVPLPSGAGATWQWYRIEK